ncbi:hypothetical protein DL98DRAFT_591042 [Cadophora sp. DSE1049]|nr:hypothetical protein DL98DRAFT_591042 [Cadophora sp. DSE1049]
MSPGLGEAVPTLLLREQSVIYAPYPHPYNLRSPWAEAEIWIFGQIRFGIHPGAIENLITRMINLLSLGDAYAHDFLEACRRILRNLATNGLFQDLPSIEEYETLVETGNWPPQRVKLTLMMCNRFEDHEMLRRFKFPPLDSESRWILQLEEQKVIEEVVSHRRINEHRMRYQTKYANAYPVRLYGSNDIFDGPFRQVNLFSSGPTGLNRGNVVPYLDEGAVRRSLAWKKAMRDRSPSPCRRVRRAIDKQRVLRGEGDVDELPDRSELLAVMDDDMLI